MSEIDPLPRSLVDELTSRLREAILTGAIAPGSRIRVGDLERTYGVSQIPIREAVRRLESEALVETIPQRGARAARMSLQELDDLYDLRRLVEVGVVRRAVGRHNEETLAKLASDLEVLDRIYDTGERQEFDAVHRRFHWNLLAPGANAEIERLLWGLWRRTGRYVRLAMTAFHSGPVGQQQHHRIYELCRSGEVDSIAGELDRHLNLTQASIHTWYETHGALLVEENPLGDPVPLVVQAKTGPGAPI